MRLNGTAGKAKMSKRTVVSRFGDCKVKDILWMSIFRESVGGFPWEVYSSRVLMRDGCLATSSDGMAIEPWVADSFVADAFIDDGMISIYIDD